MPSVHSGAGQSATITCDDPSGSGLNFAVDPQDAGTGTVLVDGSGSLTYFSNASYVGTDSWTILVTDNEGGSTEVHFTIQVVNQAPVCTNLTMTAGRGVTTSVAPNCTDPDGDAIQVHVTGTRASHGDISTQSGLVAYKPDSGFGGTDHFNYYASDSVGAGSPATVTVTVPESPPTCDPASQTLRTGKPITLHLYCSDADGDPIQITSTSAPGHGTVGAFAGDWLGYEATFTPAGSYTGPDQFTFTASDGVGAPVSGTFNLTITANHRPQCDPPPTVHTKVNTEHDIFAFCSDQDAQDQDTLVYTVAPGGAPSHGTMGAFSAFSFPYTPTTGYTGEDTVTLRASDGDLTTDFTQRLHVANTPLCSTPPAATVRSGRSRFLPVDCTQPDDAFGSLSYEVGTGPSHGTLSGLTSSPGRTYAADADAAGSDSYTIRAVGASSSSPYVTQAITTGSSANNDPVCQAFGAPTTVYAGHAASLFPFCTDPDGDALSFAAGATPAHGTSSASGGGLSYTGNAGYSGPDTVPFTVTDGHGGSTSGTIDVDVHQPQPPACSQGPIHVNARPGDTADVQLSCSNPQGDAQTYAITGAGPAKGHVSAFDASGHATYTADANATTGDDTFQVTPSDPAGAGAPQQVTVTVDPAYNRAPVCTTDSFTPRGVAASSTTTLALASVCSDPDGDPLQFIRTSSPSHGTVSAGPAATLDYHPTDGYTGPDSFTFTARDSRGLNSIVSTYYLNVVPSVAPTCTPRAALALRPGQTRSVTFDCSDPNFEQLTYEIVAAPSGTLSPSGSSTDPTRQYTAPGTAGSDSFTFRARNASGLVSTVYTQQVNVDPSANQNPSCTPNSATPQKVAKNHPTVARIGTACSDPDGDPLTFTPIGPISPQHGSLSESAGAISYTSSGTYIGADSFTYSASDGRGGTTSGTFSVDVVDTATPSCQDATATTDAGTPVEIGLDCTDADSGDTLTLAAGSARHGTLGPVDQAAGKVTFTPAVGYAGDDAGFTYSATDENGVESNPATVAITVTPPTPPSGGTPHDDAGGASSSPVAPSPPGPQPPTTVDTRDTQPPALSFAPLARQSLATALKKGLGVTVNCSERCVVKLKLLMTKALAKKLRIAAADVTIGSTTRTIAAGNTKIYVKLSSKARKRLKRARSVKLKLAATAADTAGNATSRTRALKLKR